MKKTEPVSNTLMLNSRNDISCQKYKSKSHTKIIFNRFKKIQLYQKSKDVCLEKSLGQNLKLLMSSMTRPY